MKREKRARRIRSRAGDRRRFLKWFGASAATFVVVADSATSLMERVAGWQPVVAPPTNVVVTPKPATMVASMAGPVVQLGERDVVALTEKVRVVVIRDGQVIEVREG
jgi:hypothetical protein